MEPGVGTLAYGGCLFVLVAYACVYETTSTQMQTPMGVGSIPGCGLLYIVTIVSL